MPLDAQGVYRYEEGDYVAAPRFSAFLNLVPDSVSTQLGLIRAKQPAARARRITSTATIAGAGAWVDVPFNERLDVRGTTPPTLNSGGLVTPAAGLYVAEAVVSVQVGAEYALRIVDATTPGAPIVLAQNPISAAGASLSQTVTTPPRELAASRHIRVQLFSGSAKTVEIDQVEKPCYMVLRRVEA